MARVTFVGHATVLIEIDGVRLLTDPLLRTRLGHLRRHGASPSPEVTRDLDAVLISHLHLDHLDMRSLREIERDVTIVVPAGVARFMRRMGFSSVAELAAGEALSVRGIRVLATKAVHSTRRGPLSRRDAEPLGFVVSGERSVYFAGDTDLFPEMAEAPHAGLDLALLPVWGWGPTLGTGHLDPKAAAEAAALLRPSAAVPIHWGTFYPRGFARTHPRPLRDPPHVFAAQVAEVAPSVDVRVLEPGESLELDAGSR